MKIDFATRTISCTARLLEHLSDAQEKGLACFTVPPTIGYLADLMQKDAINVLIAVKKASTTWGRKGEICCQRHQQNELVRPRGGYRAGQPCLVWEPSSVQAELVLV